LPSAGPFANNSRVKHYFAIIFCLLLPLACGSVEMPASRDDAVIVTENEGTFRFGQIYEGEVVDAYFLVINPAPARIAIDHVETTCGCTTAHLDGETISGNSRLLVHVRLNSTRLWGPQSKAVILHTTDPVRPEIKLLMEGVILRRLELAPRRIRSTTALEEYKTKARAINNTDEPLTIERIECKPDALLSIELESSLPLTLPARESVDFGVAARLERPGVRLVGQIAVYLAEQSDPVELPVYLERMK